MTYSYREDLITDRQTVGARPLESIQEVETFADSDLDNPAYQIMVSVSDGTYADADNKLTVRFFGDSDNTSFQLPAGTYLLPFMLSRIVSAGDNIDAVYTPTYQHD